MRILCVIDNLGPGGAQRQLVELGLGFREKGNEVSFLVYYNYPFFNQVLNESGITITCLEASGYLKKLAKLRRFIRQGNYNAVLSFLEGPNFICESAGFPYRKWKLVVGERNADPGILKSFKLRIYRLFHLLADHVVANSGKNIELVRRVNPILSKKKCSVIYNIIDSSTWCPVPGFEFRRNGKLKLVIASSHIYRKNLIGLVEALRLLTPAERDQLEIFWYGGRITQPYADNSYPEALQKIKEYQLENIIFFSAPTKEISQRIKNADAIGLFSFIEGLPNAVCEGMACAKPVICSRVSDVPDLLALNNNLLFDPADPGSIRDSIRCLLSLTNAELFDIGSGNLKIATDLFNREEIITSYLRLLNA